MSQAKKDPAELPVFRPYVAGRSSATEHQRVLRAPFDGRALGTVHDAGPAELEAALAGAAAAFDETRALSSQQRAAICAAVAAGLAQRKEELALAICDEGGKPIADARAEVERAVLCFELASAEAQRVAREGHVIPMDLRPPGAGRLGITRRVPVGPIAAISPFNFPLNLAAHKVAPALAAGCPVVLKPASQTPTPTLRLAEIIAATDWPERALSVLPATRAAADILVTDERCKLLTFTGSGQVGWDMKARAGKKRVVLELGGNAAVILDESVTRDDLDALVPKLIYGAFSYAGQKCISVQRIYVASKPGAQGGSLYAELCERFVAAARAVRCGDPRDPEVLVGPMIDENNARRVESWVNEAVAQGARLLCGGEREQTLVQPTVLADVPASARVACDEVFGPVCNLDRVPSFEAAVQAVNDSRYGLQAAVFTRDLGHSLRAFDELEVGAVILNEAPSFRIDHMPYGGVKDSGLGREGIRSAIEDMTELRLLVTGSLP
ncbi:MAG: aldehyde dehydrogenase family protein [Polyangia bacterium]